MSSSDPNINMTGMKAWCMYLQPPPLPPVSSPLFSHLYSYIRDNATHWDNYLHYHEKCGIALPERPSISTSRVKTSSVGLPIALSLIIVGLVILVALYCWWRVKKRRGRANLATLPLKEYESTNYLDNKARNNQCWDKNQAMTPDQSNNIEAGSPEKVNSNDSKVVVFVEPVSEILTEKLFAVKGVEDEKKVSRSKLDVSGCQNLCFTIEGGEKDPPVSPGANSLTPLFDDINGIMLPNVPQVESTLSHNDKKGNDYTTFPDVHAPNNTSVLQGQLPRIDTKDKNRREESGGVVDSLSSPKGRKKSKSSVINRTSEPVIERQMELIRDDLMENRKSV